MPSWRTASTATSAVPSGCSFSRHSRHVPSSRTAPRPRTVRRRDREGRGQRKSGPGKAMASKQTHTRPRREESCPADGRAESEVVDVVGMALQRGEGARQPVLVRVRGRPYKDDGVVSCGHREPSSRSRMAPCAQRVRLDTVDSLGPASDTERGIPKRRRRIGGSGHESDGGRPCASHEAADPLAPDSEEHRPPLHPQRSHGVRVRPRPRTGSLRRRSSLVFPRSNVSHSVLFPCLQRIRPAFAFGA